MVLNVILQINTAKPYATITLFPIGGVFHKKFYIHVSIAKNCGGFCPDFKFCDVHGVC